MNDDRLPEGLREVNWRGKPSPADAARLRAWLAAHPEAQLDLETDALLTEALERLPAATVPSNFTARVLQAVERESTREQRRRFWHWRPVWLPRVAVAAVLVGVALLSGVQVHKVQQREQLARSLQSIPGMAELPRPEVLRDFEAIRQLSNPAPDEQLLSLLQ